MIRIKTGYKVADAMTSKPITAIPESTIEECAAVMLKSHVGSLVIKEGERLKGIITEQDIVRKVVAKKKDPSKTKVNDAMVTNLITIEPGRDIYDALVVMRDNNIRHLPVVHNRNLVGYLTIKDILKIQPQLFDIIVEKFEIREQEHKPVDLSEEDICDICGLSTDKLYNFDGLMYCGLCKKNKGL